MKYIYVSQFDDNCGYGSAARGYLQSLDSVLDNCNELKIYSVSLESSMSHLSEEEKQLISKYRLNSLKEIQSFINNEPYCLIWHMPPPMMEIIHQNSDNTRGETENKWHNSCYLLKNSYKNINISAWEADNIPVNWSEIFKKRKTAGVIVPSNWNLEVYKKKISDVFCVPHLIRSPANEIEKINMPFDTNKKFVLFSMSQWDIRKGFDVLIRSYLMEFKNQEDAILILKTYGVIADSFKHLQEQQKQNIIKEIMQYKSSVFLKNNTNPTAKIIPIIGALEYQKINYLYDIADCFILATRGEGFGLTIAEAYLKNKKIIVPKEGGHLDYLQDKENIKYFDGYWSPYHSKNGYDCDMNWYEPDLLSIRKKMREAYEEWKTGQKNNMFKRETLQKEEIGKQMMLAFEKIVEKNS